MNKKIYIIHGWTYTLNAWDACVAELRSRGFDPIMLNVPGLTAHESTGSQKAWTLDEYVEWLDKSLPSAVSTTISDEIIVVGHSNGGRIALALAAQKPGRISRLVLIASAGVVHNELPLRIRRIVFGSIAKAGAAIGFDTLPLVRKVFYKIIGASDYGNASPHMRETMKNLISVDLVPRLSAIKIPTLLIWGDKDTATPVGDGKIMNSQISGSKLVILPNIGHSPHKTEPKRVAEEIVGWLS